MEKRHENNVHFAERSIYHPQRGHTKYLDQSALKKKMSAATDLAEPVPLTSNIHPRPILKNTNHESYQAAVAVRNSNY